MKVFNKKLYDQWNNRFNDYIEKAQSEAFVLTKFLNDGEIELLENKIKGTGLYLLAWGGSSQSHLKKVMLATFPIEASNEFFEISVLKAEMKFKNSVIQHKDVLGKVFSLGINHDVFGDVIVTQDDILIVINSNLKEMFLNEFTKLKNEPIKFAEIEEEYEQNMELTEKIIHVQSARMDYIISKIYNMSRAEANKLVMSRNVLVNYFEEDNVSRQLMVEDRVSVRGFGLFFVKEIKETTKDKLLIVIDRTL